MPELVIVESPGKIKKIGKILGSGFSVQASLGHVRDLPMASGRRGDGPAPSLEESVGLSFDGRWTPNWQLMDSKRANVSKLRQLGARGTVWLATDLDREGEAIAWHLREILGGDASRFRRVTFSEITEAAIHAAFAEPRRLDMELVHAYLARRFLDRVVGYTVSPLLGGRLYARVSAGRVQSAALGILVDRDEEIRVFEAKAFFAVDVPLPVSGEDGDEPVAQVLDAHGGAARFSSRGEADEVVGLLRAASLRVTGVESTRQVQHPKPPFTTSTLQQAASSRLKFSVADTMAVAQKLYEAGAITYMRSDAVFLAPESVAAARDYLVAVLGEGAVPKDPPSFAAKEGAQEAHEAIRPSDPGADQHDLDLDGAEANLYVLIRARLLASQMTDAILERTEWRLAGGPAEEVALAVKGRVVLDPGWHRALPPPAGDEPPVLPDVDVDALPSWPRGEFSVDLAESWTKPPKRYTEAALVAELESKGVGRPSTYAATLEKLVDRGYVFIDKRLFVVAPFGRLVDSHLRRNFPRVRDVAYTSRMEELLDQVAAGKVQYRALLDRYWSGLSGEIAEAKEDPLLVAAPRVELPGVPCPECGWVLLISFQKGMLAAVCKARKKCGYAEAFEWAPKRAPRRQKKKESADSAAAEDSAAEQRASGRCPVCAGSLQRWRAKTAGYIDLCGQWPLCSHAASAGGGKKPAKASGSAARRSGSKTGSKGGSKRAPRRRSS